jgi:hypothetical protein
LTRPFNGQEKGKSKKGCTGYEFVSGDKDLCDLNRYKSVRVVTPTDFFKIVK